MSTPTILFPDSSATTVRGAGDEYRYLATARQTSGTYFMMEAVVPPGGGPPPHVQTREDEGFYVLEGAVTFWVGGEEVQAGPGAYLNVPRGVIHNFKNQGRDVAKLLILFAPAGIEQMFSGMAREPDRYREIGAEYGVTFPADDQ